MANKKPMLPNAVAVLVLGICSIVPGACCWGIPGLICGIIALILANKAIKLHNDDPNKYDGFGNVKAGRICGIVGLSLSALYILYLIAVAIFWAETLNTYMRFWDNF